MTPTQQTGYNDQKAGTIDPDLSRADNPKGREYRDGMRCARRDEVDALEGALHVAGAQLDPVERAVLLAEQVTPEAPARVVDTVDGFIATTPVREGQVVVVDNLENLKKVSAAMGVPKALTAGNPYAEPEPGAKRPRKAKPVDDSQGSLFA